MRVSWLVTVCGPTLLLAGCATKGTVVTKVPGPPEPRGVFYVLPRTVIEAKVSVTRTETEAGKYTDFAGCLLNVKKVREPGVKFELGTPEFTSRGEPDPQEVHMIDLKAGAFESKTVQIFLTPEGLMSKSSIESKNEATEVLVTTLKSLASIAVAAGKMSLSASRFTILQDLKESQKATDEYSLQLAMRAELQKCLGAEALSAQGIGSVAEHQRAHKMRAEAFAKATSEDQRASADQWFTARQQRLEERFATYAEAKVMAERIAELEKKRQNLVSGGGGDQLAPPPLPLDTLKAMLKELDDTIAAYKDQYFLGTKEQKKWTGTLEMRPVCGAGACTSAEFAFFDLSPAGGICGFSTEAAQQGLSASKDFRVDGKCAEEQQKVTVEVTRLSGERQYVDTIRNAFKAEPAGERSYYFRIPGDAIVTVNSGKKGTASPEKKELARARFALAQFGVTVSLPVTNGGSRMKYSVELYEATGALKNFELSSDPRLKASQVEGIGAAVKTVLDSEDELVRLQRQIDVLEKKKKLKELQAETAPK